MNFFFKLGSLAKPGDEIPHVGVDFYIFSFFFFFFFLFNLKNVKNTYGGVLLLGLQLKVKLLHGYSSRFLNCANGTKSCKASHLMILKV